MLLVHSGVLLLAVLLALDAFRAHSWRLPTFSVGFALVVNVVWLVANRASEDGPGLFHVLLWSVDYWGFLFAFVAPDLVGFGHEPQTGPPEWVVAYAPMFLGALIQGLVYAVIGSTVLQHRRTVATIEP